MSLDEIEREIKEKGSSVDSTTNERVPLVGDATYYTAKYFPWETAGYFWMINEITEKLDNEGLSGEKAVSHITEIVNPRAKEADKTKRITNYKNIEHLIYKKENETLP